MNLLLTFAQTSQSSSSDSNPVVVLVVLIAAVLSIIAMWRVFEKANQPGWASIIPIYNTYILLKIVGRPGWWILLYFVPLVNVVVQLFVAMDLAKAFGKSTTFGVIGLWLFSIIGYYVLAFDDSTYQGAPNKTV